jgi:hypothetical protein
MWPQYVIYTRAQLKENYRSGWIKSTLISELILYTLFTLVNQRGANTNIADTGNAIMYISAAVASRGLLVRQFVIKNWERFEQDYNNGIWCPSVFLAMVVSVVMIQPGITTTCGTLLMSWVCIDGHVAFLLYVLVITYTYQLMQLVLATCATLLPKHKDYDYASMLYLMVVQSLLFLFNGVSPRAEQQSMILRSITFCSPSSFFTRGVLVRFLLFDQDMTEDDAQTAADYFGITLTNTSSWLYILYLCLLVMLFLVLAAYLLNRRVRNFN